MIRAPHRRSWRVRCSWLILHRPTSHDGLPDDHQEGDAEGGVSQWCGRPRTFQAPDFALWTSGNTVMSRNPSSSTFQTGTTTRCRSARPEADAPWLYDRQTPRQTLQHVALLEQALNKRQDELRCRLSRGLKDDDSCVVCRRLVANVGEAEVPRDQTSSFCLGVGRDCRVSSAAQLGVADVKGVVAMTLNDGNAIGHGRPRGRRYRRVPSRGQLACAEDGRWIRCVERHHRLPAVCGCGVPIEGRHSQALSVPRRTRHRRALSYAAWRAEEIAVPLARS